MSSVRPRESSDDEIAGGILADFDRMAGTYADLNREIIGLVTRLLAPTDIRVHAISGQPKERERLREKILRGENKYSRLTDVTDLARLRVITYFADDVDRVADIIEREFEIDRANSIDKRAELRDDQFGYLSLHYVAALSKPRNTLPEYRLFQGLKFEVQIRSIIQHAWAEIHHDLGYKTQQAIPREHRRDFARIAGLLETADIAFRSIRRDLASYAESVATDIQQNPDSVGIDKDSVESLVKGDPAVAQLTSLIVSALGAEIIGLDPEQLSGLADRLAYVGFTSIGEVSRKLTAEEAQIGQLAEQLIQGQSRPVAHPGVSLSYLMYWVLGERGYSELLAYLEHFDIGAAHGRPEFATKVVDAVRRISQM